MFRRRPDLSWPLIVVLFGLFLLSLRVPRQWENIARDSRLALLPPTHCAGAPAAPTTAEATCSADPLHGCPAGKSPDLTSFHVVQPAGPVGNNAASAADVPENPLVVAPLPATARIAAEVTPVSAEQPKGVEIAVSSVPAAANAAQPALPAPQLEPSAVATEEKNTEPPAAGNPLRSYTGAALVKAAAPEQATIATPQATPAATAPEPNPAPLRAVVPEPQPLASTAIPQPSNDPIAADQPSNNPVATDPRVNAASEHSSLDIQAKRNVQAPPNNRLSSPEIQPRPMRAIGRAWEEPTFLLAQLEQLKRHTEVKAWAAETINEIRKLGPAIAVGAPQTVEILRHLEQAAGQARAKAEKMDDSATAQELSSVAQALERRIVVWKQIGQMGGMVAANVPPPEVDARSLNKALADIEQVTGDSSEGRAWRKYLLVDSLREWAARRRKGDERVPSELAQQVHARLNRPLLSPSQRQFLTTGPAAALNREMVRHTAEAVESNRLLQHLEAFERSGLPSDARILARDCQFLSVSSGVAQRELGDCFETHYRNANLRVAVTAELLNRMIPQREPEYAPVEDTIQGASVRGQSLTANEISVRMVPDPKRVLMELDVNGDVAAVTRSTSGPATFYTESESTYVARKQLELNLRGIRMWPTEVSVDNSSRMRGVHTDFDRVPLFRSIAREVSISQYDEHRPAADEEVRGKIAAKAKERVDREATQQVSAAAKRLHDELLGPMDSLLLDPMVISAETTDKRFSMRIRLAGPDQLGGHTPRPQAPADSLASVQIHESLLNNMLARLELDGQTFDLAGLNRRLSERMHRFQPRPVDPDQEDVKITFAAKDAVHVRCNDGRLEITLAIARLSKGTRRFKDFQVRASYRPAVEGRSINLAREGIVKLIGPRMNVGAGRFAERVPEDLFRQAADPHDARIVREEPEARGRGGHAVRDRRRLDRRGAGVATERAGTDSGSAVGAHQSCVLDFFTSLAS